MTDNHPHNFEGPPPSETDGQSQETPRRFGSGPTHSARKEAKRSGFSPSFSPRKETSFSRRTEQPESPAPAPPSPPVSPPPPVPATPAAAQPVAAKIDSVFERQRLILLLTVMLPLGLYAFWPSFTLMARKWYYNLDYGHGFLVLPLIALFLYLRLDTYPGTQRRLAWIGLVPILFSCLMRYYAVGQRFDAVDQWAILFWTLGVVWLFYGNRVFYWACPSLLFMVFMFPLPDRFEVLLRGRLQEFAAQFAAVLLQLMGETAIPIRNTIRLSTMELGVEAACSGIRFLVSIMAIAFATILLMRRPWWQNLCIFLLAPPLALFVNAMRIAMTGILLVHYEDTVRWFAPNSTDISKTADEFSGLVMIFVAFGIFFAVVWYLGKVFRKVDV